MPIDYAHNYHDKYFLLEMSPIHFRFASQALTSLLIHVLSMQINEDECVGAVSPSPVDKKPATDQLNVNVEACRLHFSKMNQSSAINNNCVTGL